MVEDGGRQKRDWLCHARRVARSMANLLYLLLYGCSLRPVQTEIHRERREEERTTQTL
jgi:hypothetical protein